MSDPLLINSQEFSSLNPMIDFGEGTFSFSSINQIFPNSQNNDSDVGEESKLMASLDCNGQIEMIKQLQQSSSDSGAKPTSREPAIADFEGLLEFELQVGSIEQEKSNESWFSSHELNKVFIKIDAPITLLFSWNHSQMDPLHQLFIRATAVYTSPDFLRTAVVRCPTHRASDPFTDSYPPLVDHVLRCESENAIYEKNEDSERFSAKVPVGALDPPSFIVENQEGKKFVKYPIKFACQTSCPGGMERRPIHVIFTLENVMGDVYGRRVWGFKICSCPKRDIRKEEKDRVLCNPDSKDTKVLLIKKQAEQAGAGRKAKQAPTKKRGGRADVNKQARHTGTNESVEEEVDRCFFQVDQMAVAATNRARTPGGDKA